MAWTLGLYDYQAESTDGVHGGYTYHWTVEDESEKSSEPNVMVLCELIRFGLGRFVLQLHIGHIQPPKE